MKSYSNIYGKWLYRSENNGQKEVHLMKLKGYNGLQLVIISDYMSVTERTFNNVFQAKQAFKAALKYYFN
jgi:hypothetical protein